MANRRRLRPRASERCASTKFRRYASPFDSTWRSRCGPIVPAQHPRSDIATRKLKISPVSVRSLRARVSHRRFPIPSIARSARQRNRGAKIVRDLLGIASSQGHAYWISFAPQVPKLQPANRCERSTIDATIPHHGVTALVSVTFDTGRSSRSAADSAPERLGKGDRGKGPHHGPGSCHHRIVAQSKRRRERILAGVRVELFRRAWQKSPAKRSLLSRGATSN